MDVGAIVTSPPWVAGSGVSLLYPLPAEGPGSCAEHLEQMLDDHVRFEILRISEVDYDESNRNNVSL